MQNYIQVITATETKKEAENIAHILTEKRLAGCVQIIGPITSIYWWRGKIEKAEEWLCFIKTSKILYEEVEKTIKAAHSYQVPEIIALPLVSGSRDYLSWLNNELQK